MLKNGLGNTKSTSTGPTDPSFQCIVGTSRGGGWENIKVGPPVVRKEVPDVGREKRNQRTGSKILYSWAWYKNLKRNGLEVPCSQNQA